MQAQFQTLTYTMNHRTMILAALMLAIPVAFALGHWSARQSKNGDEAEQASQNSSHGSSERTRFGSTATSGDGTTTRRRARLGSATRGEQSEILHGPQLEALAVEAFNDPSQLTRSLAFAKMLESLTPENAQAAMEAMRAHRASGDQWELFRYAWGAVDPDGAMEYAKSLDERRQRGAISNVLMGWASTNPKEAIAWVNQLGDEESKSRYRGTLVSGLADYDIGTATSYVFDLAAKGDRYAARYLESVTGEQLRSGTIQDAILWTESMPRGELRGQAMDRVANRFVAEDPEAAAAWAAKYASDEHGVRVIEEVGDEWAERDPKAAVEWLRGLPQGRGQEEGMRSALGEWARRDFTAAGEYIQNMPASSTRDAAMSGYAQNVVRRDPQAAVAWANSIGQDELRVQTLERTAREWYRRDPKAAAVWLQASNLPAEAKSRVTARRDDRRRR